MPRASHRDDGEDGSEDGEAQAPVAAQEQGKAGQGEHQDGRVDEQSELLVQEQARQTLGQRRPRELGACAIHPARVPETVEQLVEDSDTGSRREPRNQQRSHRARAALAPERMADGKQRERRVAHVQPGQRRDRQSDRHGPAARQAGLPAAPQGEQQQQRRRHLGEHEAA